MKKQERLEWLLNYARETEYRSDCRLMTGDQHTVDAYCEATGAKRIDMIIGPDLCPMLTRDLRALYKDGKLTRDTIGVPHSTQGRPWAKYAIVYGLAQQQSKGQEDAN